MPTNGIPGRARTLAALLALGVVAALAPTPVTAQGKAPTGPIEITVGSSPGGTPDVIMRNVVKIMTEEKIVPNPVVVQNRTGGSWANAYNHVLGKKGDENTLLDHRPAGVHHADHARHPVGDRPDRAGRRLHPVGAGPPGRAQLAVPRP